MTSVYHGSNVGTITKFELRPSTHGVPCVYACPNYAVSVIYACRYHGDIFFQVGFDEKMKPFIVERKDGLFNKYYNREGFVYELDASTFNHYDYLWIGEMISTSENIRILNVYKIPNLLKELERLASEGHLTIYKYPSRPVNMPMDNSDLIEIYLEYYKNGISDALKVLLKFYPEFESEVFKRIAHM